MEETESAEVQSAVKEESDEFGWAEDDFAMVDASLTGQPTQSSSVKSANVPAADSEAISSSITFSTASDVSFASATASTFGAKSMEEQSWSTSRPSLPNAMDSKFVDASFTSQQAEGHGTPVFAESKTEESRADDSAVADLPKAVAEEFEIPPAESVTATAAAGDFWNDDDDDEGLFDHDDHANEEWDETIREADGEPASNPQEHGEFTVPPSVDSGSNSFMAATLPPASDVSSSIRGSVHQEEVEFSSSEFASRSNFESPSADNARFEGAAQQQWEQESVAAAVVPPATSLHPTAVAAEQVQEQPSVTSVGGDDAEHDTSSSVTTGVSFSEEHSTRLEHHTHGVSFADEMQADNSTQEQASTAWHSEEQPIDTSTTDYDTTIDTATNYEDHGETSSEMETADYEHSTGFAKSSVSWESEAIREGGADNSHGEVESVEAPAATPGKTLDSDDHDDHDEYRGDSVSLFNGTGGSNGGQSLASFSEVSSRLPPYGYQSSFAGPGSEASSTEPGTRDMDGSSIRSYGVSSAGATFGGSERVSEGPFSDGTASETPSIVDSSNASTAFGTDFPSVSEGQFSAPGTTFGGSDNVSDQFSDGNASETTSVSESTTHTTTGFVSEYQPSTGHYVTETIAETSSLNPFPDDSMDERASRGLELHNVTTTTSVSSLFGSTPDVPEYSQASLSFSHDQESSRAQYTSPPALPTESVQDQEDRSLVAETSKEVQTADALFGSSSEAPSPFSSFGGSGAAPSNSPPLVVEHELPTSDASDLFGSSAPGDTGVGFGSASAQSSGFGYDNTPYAQVCAEALIYTEHDIDPACSFCYSMCSSSSSSNPTNSIHMASMDKRRHRTSRMEATTTRTSMSVLNTARLSVIHSSSSKPLRRLRRTCSALPVNTLQLETRRLCFQAPAPRQTSLKRQANRQETRRRTSNQATRQHPTTLAARKDRIATTTATTAETSLGRHLSEVHQLRRPRACLRVGLPEMTQHLPLEALGSSLPRSFLAVRTTQPLPTVRSTRAVITLPS